MSAGAVLCEKYYASKPFTDNRNSAIKDPSLDEKVPERAPTESGRFRLAWATKGIRLKRQGFERYS
jgi:hypothetical protein